MGGADVNLVGILKPNVDPHEFEPSPSDAIGIAGAKLAVDVGRRHRQPGPTQLIATAAAARRCSIASAGLPIRTGDSEEPDGDPHWWHDPTPVRAGRPRPGRRAGPDRSHPPRGLRAPTPAATSPGCGRWTPPTSALIACLPADDRKLVTNHDAFGYFAAHYGLTVVGSVIPSISTAAEPSAHNVADLIDKIRAEHVRAIFTESSLNPALEDQIAHEAGVKIYATPVRRHAGAAGFARRDVHRHGALERALDRGRTARPPATGGRVLTLGT